MCDLSAIGMETVQLSLVKVSQVDDLGTEASTTAVQQATPTRISPLIKISWNVKSLRPMGA
jgi:hypothetical protein